MTSPIPMESSVTVARMTTIERFNGALPPDPGPVGSHHGQPRPRKGSPGPGNNSSRPLLGPTYARSLLLALGPNTVPRKTEDPVPSGCVSESSVDHSRSHAPRGDAVLDTLSRRAGVP